MVSCTFAEGLTCRQCRALLAAAFLFAAVNPRIVDSSAVRAKGFLEDRQGEELVDAGKFKQEIQGALTSMLGCGHAGDSTEQLAEIKKAILPMWTTLPKNDDGNLERRTLRYLAHRYFMQKSSLLIRGFEPSRPVSESSWGVADILSQVVPAYVESALESRHALERGFTLEDAMHMIAILEQLIFDSESTLLEKAYAEERESMSGLLSRRQLAKILQSYLVHWMMGDDAEGIEILLSNRSLLAATFPHWDSLVEFAEGQIRALEFQRQQGGKWKPRHGQDGFAQRYSFDDAHEVVGGITRSFASFWESECASMKKGLVEMDTYGTGRVTLSKFYGTALESEWRFGESEEYLRELGALDETSRWRGKQVIIPNYMQAASNCIVSTPHYLVCCVNECEELLGEIEVAIGAAVAQPSQILAVVGAMTSQTTLDDDSPPTLKGTLTKQLEQVASKHGGSVPLHGRLFAQWLHYVFPRECPFPHKMGTAATVTPSEFGDAYLARNEEMKHHASNEMESSNDPLMMNASHTEWMSQWSHEEEFLFDYSSEMRAPWEQSSFMTAGAVILLLVGLSAGIITFSRKSVQADDYCSKAHFV
mmetsp:Transcript_102487/g.187224  ORF Transcript_102487/g.187224 Transcript_102487/m.187224 type:complete len:591 (+) Transcript_102487:71-1843(+)